MVADGLQLQPAFGAQANGDAGVQLGIGEALSQDAPVDPELLGDLVAQRAASSR